MNNNGLAWTAIELELLAANCNQFTDSELATQFGRTRIAIRNARYRCDLYYRSWHDWTRLEVAALGTLTDRRIAARMGLSISAIQKKRRAMGIPTFHKMLRDFVKPEPPPKKRNSLYTAQSEDWDIRDRKRATKNTSHSCTKAVPP